MVESPNLMPLRSTCLPLDTKHPESELHQAGFVEHTPRESPNNPHFPYASNNENEFTLLNPFHTTRVLRNTLLQY